MGKLTDSLKATTKQLDHIKHGIQQMQELGRGLAENTVTVAETALKTGYAYAQAELAETQVRTAISSVEVPVATVLDADQLGDAPCWTEKLLKSRFDNFRAAYRYLKETHGLTPKAQSWQAVIDTFNQPVDRPSDDRIAHLEQIVVQQNQRLTALEAKLDQLLQHLQQLST